MKLSEPYPEHPCRLCDGFIQVGEDESKWGIDWYKGYVHFSCIENIFDATRRMRNKPEVAQLEAKLQERDDALKSSVNIINELEEENERLRYKIHELYATYDIEAGIEDALKEGE